MADFGGDGHRAAGLLGKAVDHAEAEAAAQSRPLVVKNGSNTRWTISGGIPTPLSCIDTIAYCPIGRSSSVRGGGDVGSRSANCQRAAVGHRIAR